MDLEQFCTRMVGSFTGLVVEKSSLSDSRDIKNIILKMKLARRRVNEQRELITEYDVIPVKFWASAADMINNTVDVGDLLYLECELRSKFDRLELKARHFEIMRKANNE